MSGIALSPKGAYAIGDEGGVPKTFISRPDRHAYRLIVTELSSGEVTLPSGTKFKSTATATDVLKEMTQKDKDRELSNKLKQKGTDSV
ncbi:MAG: hypothetical protein K2X28_00025 [Alphaproteobacteria bacterium]|nr:hypothetical protein [Alphaproteobacteria bacterium]